MPLLLRRLIRTALLPALCAGWLVVSAPAALAVEDVTSYVPDEATPAQVASAEPGQRHLAGISKDYPAICNGLLEPRREDAGAIADTDRVDIGAPTIELEDLEGGRAYSYCFFVHNRSSKPLTFRISATELVGSSDPNQKQDLIRPPVSVGTWIHPVITRFTLQPGERLYVPYVIDVPDGPPGGTSAGALEIVRLDAPEGAAGGGAGFSITMLHKVFVTFPGGEALPLKVTNVTAPSLLSRDRGETSYVARFNVRNEGTIVESYETKLEMRGLGLRVASTTSPVSLLLPQGAERTRVRIADMPWIGIYRPTATVDGTAGDVEVELPWLIVLPPWPYVVALVLAILFPFFVWFRRWRQARSEWQAYLEEEHDERDDQQPDW